MIQGLDAGRGCGRSCRAGVLAALVGLLGCTADVPEIGTRPILRGHDEVILRPDGSLLPLIFADGGSLGLCLQVDPSQDTSRWKMTITFGGRPSPSGAVAAAARSGPTVCFDAAQPAGLPDGTLEVCGRIVDEFDGRRYRVACQEVRHQRDSSDYRALETMRDELTRRAWADALGIGELLPRLEGLEALAADHGYAVIGEQAKLIAVHFLTLEGGADASARAEAILDSVPDWLEEPQARHQAALTFYQRGIVHLDFQGRLEEAWSELAKADRYFRQIADPKRFTVTMAQASILHQVGAVGEAINLLRDAIAECEPRVSAADQPLLETGKNHLAWLILQDPDASREELAEAETYIREGLSDEGADRLELANRWVDLAYLAVRRGQDPGRALESARETLATLHLGSDRGRRLRAWADLVEGESALARGDAAAALDLCTPFRHHPDSDVAAWALSCLARAHRMSGDPAAAERAIEEALLLAYDAAPVIRQQRPIGPSQHAEDFARAARLAVERGEAERAWKLLADLDHLSTGEAERLRCRERASGAERERWRQIEAEIASILESIRALEVPASPARHEQQKRLLRTLKTRLEELWHEWPGCENPPPASDEGLRYRAFDLEDEIIVLRRDEDGSVEVEKRTPFARRDLRHLHDRILTAFASQSLDDDAWAELLRPVAEALTPRGDAVVPHGTVTYALHGLLQAVPMAALPLDDGSGFRWLGQKLTVVLQPAGAQKSSRGEPPTAPPLFVVDPLSNLRAAPRLLATYRDLFPRARILYGEEATYAAFVAEVKRAEWLHVDAHGVYDPVFPQLSALELADRPIHWVELADTPMSFRFAHLSGCQTGRWPITADSGTYGIAGLVTRLGVGWAIASRADLSDRVAEDFNRVFYRAIDAQLPVPEAYHRALSAVAEHHPAVAWAGLVLLRAAGAD